MNKIINNDRHFIKVAFIIQRKLLLIFLHSKKNRNLEIEEILGMQTTYSKKCWLKR